VRCGVAGGGLVVARVRLVEDFLHGLAPPKGVGSLPGVELVFALIEGCFTSFAGVIALSHSPGVSGR
jgi:hypothetical protein